MADTEHNRRTALVSGVSKAAALGILPIQQVSSSAPMLEYETMPDGKVRITSIAGAVDATEQSVLADELQSFAHRRQADVDRVQAARAKRLRKAQARILAHG